MFWTQLGKSKDGRKKRKKDEGLSVLVYIDTLPSSRHSDVCIDIDMVDANNDGSIDVVENSNGNGNGHDHDHDSNNQVTPPSSPQPTTTNEFMSSTSTSMDTPIRSNTQSNIIHKRNHEHEHEHEHEHSNDFHNLQFQFPDLKIGSRTPLMQLPITESAAGRITSFARRRLGSASASIYTTIDEEGKSATEAGNGNQNGNLFSRTNSCDSGDYENHNHDDSSIGSASSSTGTCASVVEHYIQLRIDIGKKDGIISFLDENEKSINAINASHEENCTRTRDVNVWGDDHVNNDDDVHDGASAEVHTDNGNDNETQNNLPLHALNKRSESKSLSRSNQEGLSNDIELPTSDTKINTTSTSTSTAFELIPTKNQIHKDHQQKEYHQTRKACLEAAAEAYKKASLEVPDMILAQINDHRNLLRRKNQHNALKDADKSKLNAPTPTPTRARTLNANVTVNVVEKSKSMEEEDEPNKQKQHVKRIKLCKTDEIHAAPCQCALRLVGMRERQSFIDESPEAADVDADNDNDNDAISSIFGTTFLGGSRAKRRHVRTASVLMTNVKYRKSPNIPEKTLVRTASAQASSTTNTKRTNGRDGAKGVKFANKDETNQNVKNKSGKRGLHTRSESNLFTSLGYHEITLIRNQQQDHRDDVQDGSSDADGGLGLLPWDAVTIRCSTHDELDILIKSLKDSSHAKVVPFSSNPKERLRQLRAERGKKEKARSSWRSALVPTLEGKQMQMDGSTCRGVTLPRALVDPICMKEQEQESCSVKPLNDVSIKSENQKEGGKNPKQIREKRKPWDLNFNKKEYCEVCDLTFTLLTRRHHCRECERSCCGHCSTLLIVKGCDEKRYCNSCASGILQKQSEALQGKLRMKTNETSLPGKVSDACMPLGVGVTGRLPYWKTFLRPNLENRPAVGRLTVEVLSALALPSVDMLNGKVDPYVRATITGYDRDMKWTLRQWMTTNRYSLCSRFCTATLSPQWRGSGRKGGELLTLPVISTAGAVLRLEVLHYNVLTNSRGKDVVLGTVEIPLSDIPNANLRHPGGIEVETSDGRRKSLTFDGYCDRWYRLVPQGELDSKSIVLSKPIESSDFKFSKGAGNRKVGLQSLEEVGKRAQALAIAPIEWIASAIKLDLPAKRPESICQEHKARSMIHVRIKMNASMFGDIISHAWFPPVRPCPVPPAYDPEILLSRILNVGKLTAPYRKIIKYIEFCIKWKHEPIVCIKAYLVFALHLLIFPHLIPIFHVYLYMFLANQSFQMTLEDDMGALQTSIHCTDSNEQPLGAEDVYDDNHESIDKLQHNRMKPPTSLSSADETISTTSRNKDSSNDGIQADFHSSPSLQELSQIRQPFKKQNGAIGKTQFTPSSSNESLINAADKNSNGTSNATEEEETKLNIAISWIARRLGENKGLEVLQFKLGNLGRDLRNINSVWDGSNPLLTRAAMVYLVISFILHFLTSQRLLWLIGTSTFFFSQSPFVILTARFMFGFWRGIAKATRRQQLLDAEILSTIG